MTAVAAVALGISCITLILSVVVLHHAHHCKTSATIWQQTAEHWKHVCEQERAARHR